MKRAPRSFRSLLNRRRRSPAEPTRSRRRRLSNHLESLESRQLLAAITGVVFNDVNLDGIRDPGEGPAADVRVYIDENVSGAFEDGELSTRTDSQGIYSFNDIPGGEYSVRIEPTIGQVQVGPAVTFGVANVVITTDDGELQRASQLFSLDGTNEVELIGQGTTNRLDGLVRIADGSLIGADIRDNTLFQINPVNGEIQRIGTTNLDIVGGLAFDPVGNSVLTLVRGNNVTQLGRVNVNTAQVDLIGPGFAGLDSVADIEYDLVNERVIGFDDTDNEFFAFDIGGNGARLSLATMIGELGPRLADIDTDSLAIAGFEWSQTTSTAGGIQVILFNEDDRDQTEVLIANVDTGMVRTVRDVEMPLQVNALTRPRSGNVAQTITLTEFESRGGIDFQVADDVIGFRVEPAEPGGGPVGGLGVTVVGGSVGSDVVQVTLNRPPVGVVQLNLTLVNPAGGEIGAVLSDTVLTFTPDDWATPRIVTVSPDAANPIDVITRLNLIVSVDGAVSDIQWIGLANQSLPVRVLPATEDVDESIPVINEILVGGGDVDQSQDQFIELRGQPGSVLPDGSYFVVVSEEFTETGEIETVIDLSGQAFGSNGFLVLLQANSEYAIDPQSRILQSDVNGFEGLPGDIFGNRDNSGELHDDIFDVTATTFFFIQTDTPPLLDADIDANGDGLIDAGGIASNWTIWDSISMQPFVGGSNQAYGRIVGVDDPLDNRPAKIVAPGTTIVYGNGIGYAARVGDSLGSRTEDWVFADVNRVSAGFLNNDDDDERLFEVQLGRREYHPLFDRPLDHVGESNFVAGIRGRINLQPAFNDPNFDPDAAPIPGEGILVFADTNGNGVLDNLTFTYDPDDLIPPFDPRDPAAQLLNYPATNAFPGVTITQGRFNSDQQVDTVFAKRQERFNQPTNNRVFGTAAFDGFESFDPLRFDFARPVSSVSLDAVPLDFNNQIQFARLDAYNDRGELIASVTSDSLTFRQTRTVTVSTAGELIYRIDAYGTDDGVGFDGVTFDNLQFVQSEPNALTDQNGIYEIVAPNPGIVDLRIVSSRVTGTLTGASQRTIALDQNTNIFFNDLLRPNSRPEAGDLPLSINENLAEGTPVGSVQATDADDRSGASLTYELTGGGGRGFDVNPLTGIITVAAGANLDFETDPVRNLTVRVTDPQGDSAISRVNIQLLDVNEAPIVDNVELIVTEDIIAGTEIGRIPARDPDIQRNQSLTFTVLGGTAAEFFSVDSATGVVRLTDPSGVDFETNPSMTLRIQIQDDDPFSPESIDVDQVILVRDRNDTPTLAQTRFSVTENSTGDLFQLTVIDPDADQTHQFEIISQPATPLFEITSAGVVRLLPGRVLDFEAYTATTAQVSFRVNVADNGTPPLASTQTVILDIVDVNEPAQLSVTSISINEDTRPAAGTDRIRIGVVSLTDADNDPVDSTLTWIPQNLGDVFAFQPDTGELFLLDSASLDHETIDRYELQFRIESNNNQSPVATQGLTVQVLDVNEAPMILTDRFVVSENPNIGDVIGRLQTSDPESDPLTFQIVGGSAAEFFTLVDETQFGPGVQNACRVSSGGGLPNNFVCVSADVTFDVESDDPPAGGWTLDILASDGQLESTRTITLGVNDVNEPPTFDPALLAQFRADVAAAVLQRGQPFSLQIPTNIATDPENDVDILLRVFDADGGLPDWLQFNSETGVLSGTPGALDFGTLALTLRAIEFGPFPRRSDVAFELDVPLGNTPLTNPIDPLDVNVSGDVTPVDALRVINFISLKAAENNGTETGNDLSVDAGDLEPFLGFVDVNGDGRVGALDALIIINALNQQSAPAPSGEAIDVNRLTATISPTDMIGEQDNRRSRAAAVDAVLTAGLDGSKLF